MFCTNCGNDVVENAMACIACGVPPRLSKKFCYSCGATVNEAQAMCVKCGVGLNQGKANGKKKVTAGICAILVGGFGVHKFYHGSWGWGILYLLFCWTYVPGIVALVEGIIYLTMDDSKYDEKYNAGKIGPFCW